MASNVRDAYNVLIREGLPARAAQALVARFQQESGPGLNTTAHGDRNLPGGSHGIAQWNRERLAGLKKFGGDNWTDLTTQARYVAHELRGPEKAAGRVLFDPNQSNEAYLHAAMSYERPAGWTRQNPAGGHGYQNTQRNFMNLPQVLGGGGGDTVQVANRGVTLNSVPTATAVGSAAPALPPPVEVATLPPATPGEAATPAAPAQQPGIIETAKEKGWAAGVDRALGDEKFMAGIGQLANAFGGGGGGQAQPQQAPVPMLPVEPDDSAQRLSMAQPLMASLLAKRRGRVPGLSLTGMG